MASIQTRQTKTGQTRYAVLYRERGKQTSTTYPTRAPAERFLALINAVGVDAARHAMNQQLGIDLPTVGALVDAHINNLSGVTEGTRSDYKSYRKDLGTLEAIPADALTRAAVAKWVNDLTGRLSGKSIRNRHSLLSAAFTRAQRDGLVSDNPAKGVRLPRSIRRDMTTLTHGEFAQLLGATPAYWQPLLTTLVNTGMRWGEVTALAVKDCRLDDDGPHIQVRQAWKHTDGHGREVGPPKTRRGARRIDIGPETVNEIRPLLKGRKADDLVFVNTQGRPITQSTFLVHVWRPALKASGLSKTPRVHDLRHTCASWLIAEGVPLTVIQDRLGHESIQTTSDTYGHLQPGAGRAAAAVMSRALSSAYPVVLPAIEAPKSPDGR